MTEANRADEVLVCGLATWHKVFTTCVCVVAGAFAVMFMFFESVGFTVVVCVFTAAILNSAYRLWRTRARFGSTFIEIGSPYLNRRIRLEDVSAIVLSAGPEAITVSTKGNGRARIQTGPNWSMSHARRQVQDFWAQTLERMYGAHGVAIGRDATRRVFERSRGGSDIERRFAKFTLWDLLTIGGPIALFVFSRSVV